MIFLRRQLPLEQVEGRIVAPDGAAQREDVDDVPEADGVGVAAEAGRHGGPVGPAVGRRIVGHDGEPVREGVEPAAGHRAGTGYADVAVAVISMLGCVILPNRILGAALERTRRALERGPSVG